MDAMANPTIRIGTERQSNCKYHRMEPKEKALERGSPPAVTNDVYEPAHSCNWNEVGIQYKPAPESEVGRISVAVSDDASAVRRMGQVGIDSFQFPK